MGTFRGLTEQARIAGECLAYLWGAKLWWVIPVVSVLLIFGMIMDLGGWGRCQIAQLIPTACPAWQRPQPIFHVPFHVLVRWVSYREILVPDDGRLAVDDIRGTKRNETTIWARSATDAFFR